MQPHPKPSNRGKYHISLSLKSLTFLNKGLFKLSGIIASCLPSLGDIIAVDNILRKHKIRRDPT